MGKVNGKDFVEVAYHDYLFLGIVRFKVYFYDDEGMVMESIRLAPGNFSQNGLTLTFVVAETGDTAAAALVNDNSKEVLYFLSTSGVVLAVEGPAEGMISTDISAQVLSRLLQEEEGEQGGNSSSSLVGNGCEFEEFMFAETPSTPGAPNVGQVLQDCKGFEPPTAAPSFFVPGGEDGISTGAIIGIAVSGGLLCIISVLLIRGASHGSEE